MHSNRSGKLRRVFQSVVSTILLIFGGAFTCSGGIVCIALLTWQIKVNGFWEQIFSALLSLLLTAISASIAWVGWKLRPKKPKKNAAAAVQKPATAAAQKPSTAASQMSSAPSAPDPEKICVTAAEKSFPTISSSDKASAPSCWKQEEEIKKAREEMGKTYQAFLETDGKLPQGFSAPYLRQTAGYCYQGTPFDVYVDKITQKADGVYNKSGISDWLHLDACMEINRSAAEVVDWVHRHIEMQERLRKMCHIGDTHIMPPLFQYCRGHVMVILDDAEQFLDISQECLTDCKAAGVSFCTILSDRKLYDFMEQKEKGVSAVSYPNYHDETYADWYFIDKTSCEWRFL